MRVRRRAIYCIQVWRLERSIVLLQIKYGDLNERSDTCYILYPDSPSALCTMLYALCSMPSASRFALKHFDGRIGNVGDIEDHQPIEGIIEIGVEVEAKEAGILPDVLLHQHWKLDMFRLELVQYLFKIEGLNFHMLDFLLLAQSNGRIKWRFR